MGERKITITPGGPYIVSGDVPLNQAFIEPDENGDSKEWSEGKSYDTGGGASYALCRCGRSKHKPFCDGSHMKAGWNRPESASRAPYLDSVKTYKGSVISMLDREELCVGARFCDRGLNAWNYAMKADAEHPEYEEAAVYEACNCPSGRLTVEKGGELIEPELKAEISLAEDKAKGVRGPLAVKGGITLVSADGTEYEIRNRYTLCRCGMSLNLPFCDASHFMSEEMQGLDE
ncbi:MAG: CDGSH iron-sulfur domain-containing protein [Clostridiales Family XIII bacterium]|jgi:CDGSH-type Zn-finger protein|nr:CDGSH iron-sulfur domain-containing protein [Clostridiales Family XIII bacterium]